MLVQVGAAKPHCALLAVIACLPLLGQNGTPPTTGTSSAPQAVPRRSPEYRMYQALFWHIVMQERFGDRLDAEGHDSRGMRAATRKVIGLTVAEDNLLKSVAKDWMAKDRACRDQMLQLSKTASRPDRMALWQTVQDQEQAIMADHIAQLQNGLGPDRFAVLDAWVRANLAPGSHLQIRATK